jgi:fumarate hydratase subunit beta
MIKNLTAPFIDKIDKDILNDLVVGDEIFLSGIIYTARDAVHKKIYDDGHSPIDLKNQVIYYTGPTPTPDGKIIGSCGPTTSSRMDIFTPFMIEKIGISAMIGKGKRDKSVIDSCVKNSVVYFIALGGCGALLADCVKKVELIAYPELLSEAIYKLEIKNMPLIVGIDTKGGYIYV